MIFFLYFGIYKLITKIEFISSITTKLVISGELYLNGFFSNLKYFFQIFLFKKKLYYYSSIASN